MQNAVRTSLALAATLVFAAGCSHEGATGTEAADLASLSLDASVGADAGQASLPGFTMSPDQTFQGSMGAGDQCAFVASTGRVECQPVTRNGLTFTRSYAFYTAAGTPQPHPDSLTRSTNTKVAVKGTTTLPNGSATVDRASTLTVSGLGAASNTHTLNGAEQGTSTATLSTDRGSATVTESFSATTANVVVPRPFGATSWPTSGTTTRASTRTISRGGATVSSITGEKVTYNGTSVVPVILTRDGTSRSCTRDLSKHTLSC